MSDEEKKQRAEIEAKNAEITAKNEKIKNADAIARSSFEEGNAAFKSGNYDLAIEKYSQGITAVPDFIGSTPALLNNRASALTARAKKGYQAAKTGDEATKAAAAEKAKSDFGQAIESYKRSIEILASAPADKAGSAEVVAAKLFAMSGLVDVYSAIGFSGVDPARLSEAAPALDAYVAAETDEVKKMKVLLSFSDNMRNAGDMKNAIHGYRKYIEKRPDDVDALAGLGLSLFNEGVSASPENKEEEQEGLNLLNKFVTTAPDTHPLKGSVKDAIDYLQNTAKLAPQKVAPAKKKQ
jgi:tetratricopeptide (TPR) repeat protein